MPAVDLPDFDTEQATGALPEFEDAAPVQPPDLSKIKLDASQMLVGPNGVKRPSGMESGTEFTTALAGGALRAAAVVPPGIQSLADIPSRIARGVAMGQGHYADMPAVGEERKAQAEGFGEAMSKPIVPLDIFKAQTQEDDPAWAAAIKSAERMLVAIPEFVESPLGVLTMGAGLGGKAATTAVRYGFAADMLKGMFQQVPQLRDNWKDMTANQQAEAITQFLGSAAMVGLLTHPEMRGEVKNPLANVADRTGQLAPDAIRLAPGGRPVFGADVKAPISPEMMTAPGGAVATQLPPPGVRPPEEVPQRIAPAPATAPLPVSPAQPRFGMDLQMPRAAQPPARPAEPPPKPTAPAGEAAPMKSTEDAQKAGLAATGVDQLEAWAAQRRAVIEKQNELMKLAKAEPDKAKQAALLNQIGMLRTQIPREAIETATNTGSAVEGVGNSPASKLGKRPLDWRTNPEVADWLRKNGEALGIKLPDELKAPKPAAAHAPSAAPVAPAPAAPTTAPAAAPATSAKTPAAKEMWQMTRDEFLAQPGRKPDASHYNVVEMALREGKPVPPEVLAEYPNLKPKTPAPSDKSTSKFIGSAEPGEVVGGRRIVANERTKKGAEAIAAKIWEKSTGDKPVVEGYLNGKHKRGWIVHEPESKPDATTQAAQPSQGGIGGGINRAMQQSRKGEAGFVTIPKPVTDAVKKSRDTLKTLWKTKDVRDVMTYMKDVAGNAATVYGQQVGNNVRGQLRRAMGRGKKPNVLDENALTFVREANGDRSQLAIMRGKLTASTLANTKWKAAALKAIDHADSNWDRLAPISQQYEAATDAQVAAENAAGINTLSRPGYVMHAQDVQNDFGFYDNVAGEGATGFKHARAYPTFADSIAAGVDPKSINGVALLSQRVARGQMLINNRAWVESLRTTVDPQTRKSVVTDPEVIQRGPGLPPDIRAPHDYVTEIAGGRPIAVLKSYAGVFRALTEPSKFSESLGWNMALKAATTGKHIALMLDTFHLGRIAFWESIIKPLSLTDPKAPLPSYKRGVLTLDYSPAELQRMANSGEIPPAHLPEILQAQRDVNGLVQHGYNVAKISDQLHQEWMQQLPITGQFNKWLFNQFQRGAMAEVGSIEVPRYRRMHPSWTDEQVYREVAKDLNTRFGNLGRQGIFKSKTAQDMARILFLAPQWNEGLLRSEASAVTGAVKGVASSLKEGRLSFGVLPRAVGAMLLGQFAANQIINYATRGKPTWENEEEGIGAKLSAWVPDVIGGGPGFFLHPAGLAAEVTHLLSQKYSKKGDFREALMAFMGGRWSTLARPAVTFLTRRDIFQKLIRPENIWKETGKAALPAPIGASAAVPAIRGAISGQNREPFPGAYQRQVMSSAGVKTDLAESPSKRIIGLAQNWKKSQGIPEAGEFYESAYGPLRDDLRRGDTKAGQETYQELLKTHTAKQIEAAMKPWTGGTVNRQTLDVIPRHPKPLTGSAKHEREFLATLTPEQRQIYQKSAAERSQQYQAFRNMLQQPKTTASGDLPEF